VTKAETRTGGNENGKKTATVAKMVVAKIMTVKKSVNWWRQKQ